MSRLKSVLVAITLAGFSWAVASAQVAQPSGQARDTSGGNPVPATGQLSGQITIAGTGRPVDGARVTISGGELRDSRSVMTDDEGRYAFTALPAGTFTVRATLPGHVAGTYGQRAPGRQGAGIVLSAGQQRKDVSFEIAKGSVISGFVFDEKGRPAVDTPVRVMRSVIQSGVRTLEGAGSAVTDDRGAYRVYNLMPGDYVVSAVPRNSADEVITTIEMQRADQLRALGLTGTTTMAVTMPGSAVGSEPAAGYAPVYFPGTPEVSSAKPVRVGIAEEQLGIDFTLQRVPLTTISGQVMVPPGQSPTSVQLRLLRPEGNALGGVGQMSARPSENGSFTFRSVVPGQYIVFAYAVMTPPRPQGLQIVQPPPAGPPALVAQQRLWAKADVTVDGSYRPLINLTLQEGVPVSGYIVFDGASPLPRGNQRVRVTINPIGQPLQSAAMGSWSTDAEPGGRFTIGGVVPWRHRVSATAQGWQLKSATVNGVDVLDFPFVIDAEVPTPELILRFGDRHTGLRGKLTTATGTPTADYSVIIFPDDQKYWIPFARRMRSARPSTDGTFAFTGLPPGDYRLAAVTDVEAGEWLDPEFLRQLLPASISIRLAEGQPTVQDIRVR